MASVSVVIPVKDGGPLLGDVLRAIRDQGEVELIDVPPREFGHGRTRNLGARRAGGDLIAFLTQDAVPAPGWLDALVAGFGLAERVGAVFGPHLPRAETGSTWPIASRRPRYSSK